MATEKDVAKIVAMLSAAYPNWQPNQYTVEIYFQDLQDIDSELLMVAVKHCRTTTGRDQRFAPSAGEIRQAAAELKRQAQGIPSAIEAWNEICHARHRDVSESHPLYIGGEKYTTDPDPHQWSHPLVERVAKSLGWPRFPNLENESTDRAHLFKQYESELQTYIKQDAQPEDVKAFVDTRRAELSAGNQVKQLTKGMSK